MRGVNDDELNEFVALTMHKVTDFVFLILC